MSHEPELILVFSESADVALELLTAARPPSSSDDQQVVFVAFDDTETETALARGADRVIRVEGTARSALHAEAAVQIVAEVARRVDPSIILIGATVNGAEIAARVAQRLETACVSECTSLAIDGDSVSVERGWLGGFVARQIVTAHPAVITVPPGRYEIPRPGTGGTGGTEMVEVKLPPARVRTVATRNRECSGVRLDKARIILGAGRGLRDKQDLGLLRECAETLEGAVGATRPVTDDFQWLPVDLKIGLSGQTVRPDLYIACGISGQIEHIVGMRESRVVVAINRDQNALIMNEADYVVVGDLYEIVPALTRVLREVREKGARAVSAEN